MKKGLLQFAILIFLSHVSCVFQPDLDDNFNVVNPEVDIPPVQINLENVGDTILLSGQPIEFSYSITGLDAEADYKVMVTLEAGSYFVGDSLTGSFYYRDSGPKTGYETMTLQVVLKSGTGSLADHLGVESIVFEQSWVLHVDTNPPGDIFITSIKPENGSLKVAWTPYTRINFKRYRITIMRGHFNEQYVIEDQNSNYFYDSSYVGGQTLYSVSIETQTGASKMSPNTTYQDNEAPALVDYEIVPPLTEPNMRVSFSASKYPVNVGRYEVYESTQPNDLGNLIFTSTDPMDTSFIAHPKFGRLKYIQVRTFGRQKGPLSVSIISPSVNYLYGESITPYDAIYFAPLIDRYFTIKGSVLKGFSLSTNVPAGTLNLPNNVQFNLSPLQDKLLAMNVIDGRFYIWDALTFNLTNQYNFGSLLDVGDHFFGFGLTKDNHLLFSRGYTYGDELVKVNLATQTVVNEYNGFGSCQLIEMSDDNTAVRRQDIYSGYGTSINKIDNGQLVLSGLTAPDHEILVFNPDDFSQAMNVSIYSEKITIKDIATKAIVSQITTPVGAIYSLDPDAGFVGGFENLSTLKYMAFDYVNQELLWTGVIDASPILYGNYLYSFDGLRLKIKQ